MDRSRFCYCLSTKCRVFVDRAAQSMRSEPFGCSSRSLLWGVGWHICQLRCPALRLNLLSRLMTSKKWRLFWRGEQKIIILNRKCHLSSIKSRFLWLRYRQTNTILSPIEFYLDSRIPNVLHFHPQKRSWVNSSILLSCRATDGSRDILLKSHFKDVSPLLDMTAVEYTLLTVYLKLNPLIVTSPARPALNPICCWVWSCSSRKMR